MSSTDPNPRPAEPLPWLDARPPSRRSTALVLGVSGVVVSVGALAWLCAIMAYGVDVPRMDQYYTPAAQIRADAAGTLDLALLATQHNESRKLVPNLLSLALVHARGFWDLRAELILSWALCMAVVASVAALAWQTTRDLRSTAAIAALYSGLIWSSHTFYFHFFSVTFERTIPQLALLVVLVAFVRFGTTWATMALASLGCLVSQYSYASGVVVWPLVLVFVVASEGRGLSRKWPLVAAFVASAVPAFALYFRDYVRPGHHTPLTDIFGQAPGDMVVFLLHFIGNAVTSKLPWRATVWGAVVLTAFVALGARRAWPPPQGAARRALAAWGIVGLYTLSQGVLSMVGRLPMRMGHALRGDYVTHPIYLFVATAALAMLSPAATLRRAGRAVALAGAVGLCLTAVKPVLWKDIRELGRGLRYARACLVLADLHEEPVCLDEIHWSNSMRTQKLREIAPHLHTPMRSELVVGASADPEELTWQHVGDRIVIRGRVRVDGESADAVVTVLGEGAAARIVQIDPVGRPRPGTAPLDGRSLGPADFEVVLDPDGVDGDRCALHLHAMDNDLGLLRPITGANDPLCAGAAP